MSNMYREAVVAMVPDARLVRQRRDRVVIKGTVNDQRDFTIAVGESSMIAWKKALETLQHMHLE